MTGLEIMAEKNQMERESCGMTDCEDQPKSCIHLLKMQLDVEVSPPAFVWNSDGHHSFIQLPINLTPCDP